VGGAAATELPDGARITDIAPTVVDYFGLPQPEPWVGRSLVALS